MSFLAQLRQQQPANEQALTLCYVLHIQQPTQHITLQLVLAQLHQGQLTHDSQPYSIQQQHLEKPPPYIQPPDMVALRTLLDESSDWLECSRGSLPRVDSRAFLQGLIKSGRCFIESQTAQLHFAREGAELPVSLCWTINPAGEQQLQWKAQRSQAIFDVAGIPFVYSMSADRCLVSTGLHTLSAAAINAVTTNRGPLTPQAIRAFLDQHEIQWQQWGLPLPRELPHTETIPATITPVIQCYHLPASPANPNPQSIAQLLFRYCDKQYCMTLNPEAPNTDAQYWDGATLRCLKRNIGHEHALQQQLAPLLSELMSMTGSDPSQGIVQWYSDDKKVWPSLFEKRAQLEALGFQLVIAPDFRHHYVFADHWQVHIDNADADTWQLSLQLSVDGTSVNLLTLLDQLRALNAQQHDSDQACLALPDSRLLLLPIEKVTGIFEGLGDLLQHNGHELRLPDSQLYRLNALHEQLPATTQWQGDVELLSKAIHLHDAPIVLASELTGVNAKLRPYQWLGVCWLQHVKQHGINGSLADDMGLGKTLQTLAHLSLEHQQGALKQPALIIVPTSLLSNWAAEIQRFVPHLRHQIIHGPQRHQYWEQLNQVDIVISSYSLIVNDLHHWQQQILSWVILDEAQIIKNPHTRVSQAVRQLRSDYRLCLSGTPVENHLGELWSLLDFLMPNCLGTRTDFQHYYQKPIEKETNSDRLQELLSRIAPLMLRRSKDQVAQDLPPKTEMYQTVHMDDEQQALYEQIKDTGWAEIQAQGEDKQSIQVLTALLKLRQVCCDPQLVGNYSVNSAKRQHCMDMIVELVAEKRAILLFSQFTGMLDLLAEDLQVKNINYLMLTGKTRHRQQVVDAFQQGDAPVFLISLKAGGVGLNLTRADTVIHYDPWWNSAAEQQATDRAHRIGQDKPLFVYKLIAENTIEEKIAQLQQHKALLGDHVNSQAKTSATQFAINVEDVLALWREENTVPC